MRTTLVSTPRALFVDVSNAGHATTRVSALLIRPPKATALLVLGHGAGAGMRHPFMEALAEQLANKGVATLRYQFPYVEAGRRRPDPAALLIATVRAAVATGRTTEPELPLFAGGKSMGGRMTSLAMAERTLDDVRGLVFVGFPLHPAGRPSNKRAEHLIALESPMLFLQGTRDRLAELQRIRSLCETLGPRATLDVIDGADHGFKVLKRLGRTDDEVLDELASRIARWVSGLCLMSD